jgi:hypothetical protein
MYARSYLVLRERQAESLLKWVMKLSRKPSLRKPAGLMTKQ